jgi:Na+/proline symporter
MISTISESKYSQVFFFDDFMSGNHFLKCFFGGMFITIGMTGLDQDMMQKNLSCKNVGDAQKNMISMAVILVFVNLIFLALGALLYLYAEANMPDLVESIANGDVGGDLLFSTIARSEAAGPIVGIVFLLGLIAAAYSSADSALTALTTSFSVDFLNIKRKRSAEQERTRRSVHVGMSFVLVMVILLLKYTTDSSAIDLLMTFAAFTYGPLIGVFFFGIISKRSIKDILVPFVCFVSIFITFYIWYNSYGSPGLEKGELGLLGTFSFGWAIIVLNSFITFIGLFAFSKKQLIESA